MSEEEIIFDNRVKSLFLSEEGHAAAVEYYACDNNGTDNNQPKPILGQISDFTVKKGIIDNHYKVSSINDDECSQIPSNAKTIAAAIEYYSCDNGADNNQPKPIIGHNQYKVSSINNDECSEMADNAKTVIANDDDMIGPKEPKVDTGVFKNDRTTRESNTLSFYRNNGTYPADCYSFLSLHDPCTGPVFFAFGLAVFLVQMGFLILFMMNVMGEKFRTTGDIDNPGMGFFAQFIDSNSVEVVTATQILAIFTYNLFADSALSDVITAVETFPKFDKATPTDKTRCMVFSCVLRIIQGGLAILATFLLVVTSGDVVAIILDFTAVNFISNIDDFAFKLAKSGRYGLTLEREAKSIEKKTRPRCIARSSKARRFWFSVLAIQFFLFGALILIKYKQISVDHWTTETFRVQFDKSTGLGDYTGCYEKRTFDDGSLRQAYERVLDVNVLDYASEFGYCADDRRWYLYKGQKDDPCKAGEDKLARSAKTFTFDISTSYGETWTSIGGSPLDLYFVELYGDSEDDCILFDNGVCNEDLNSMDYQYDGGDCCAATCSHSNCGVRSLSEVFNVTTNKSEYGYSNCKDPSMVPIVIHLNNIVNSFEPKYHFTSDYAKSLGYTDDLAEIIIDKFGDLDGIISNLDEANSWFNDNNPWGRTFTVEHWWFLQSDPSPQTLLNLYCDGKSVLSIHLDKPMENKTQIVKVKDGADCILDIVNQTKSTDVPIWYINYTIYHDEEMRIKIGDGFSFDRRTVDFKRIQDCFSDVLQYYGYSLEGIGYGYLTERLEWLNTNDPQNQPCSDDFSIERYALSMINYAIRTNETDDLGKWMNTDMYCTWPSVDCEQGSVVTLDLTAYDNLSGYIPKEIVLLSKLKDLNFGSSGLTGTIPSLIGSLSNLKSIDLTHNQLTGPIPTEIGLLKDLEILYLGYNQFTGYVPSHLGSLTTLKWVNLGGNMLLPSTVPTQIERWTLLEKINLANTAFSGTLPISNNVQRVAIYNSSIDSKSIPTSVFIVEPCIVCDGAYDSVKSRNNTIILPSSNCPDEIKQLKERNKDSEWWKLMLTIDECKKLVKRCVVCH